MSESEADADGAVRAAHPVRAAHLAPVAGDWLMWRDICLRSAGFPVDLIETFADGELGAAADAILAAEDRAVGAVAQARRLAYDRVRSGRQVRYWRQAQRLLARGRECEPPADDDEGAAALEAARTARQALAAARAAWVDAWESAARRTQHAARLHAASPLFREAVSWQNPSAVETALDRVLARDVGTGNAAARQHMLLVARYLQRYCVKNDTIGFFGPMAWATLSEDNAACRVRPAAHPIAARTTRFETWAVLTIAQNCAARMREWLCPRLAPHLWREGNTLVGPRGARTALGAADAALLQACDGATTARAIAEALAETGVFPADADARARLEYLARQGVVDWSLALPAYHGFRRAFQEAFDRIGDASLRAELRGNLDALYADLARLHAAAGADDQVRAHYRALAGRFERVTGKSAARRPGAAYAGRTLVTHDCMRAVDVEFGNELVQAIAAPLAIVLDAARWFTARLAIQFADFVDGLFEECRTAGAAEVPFDVLWQRLAAPHPTVPAIVADVAEQLQERWAELVTLDARQQRQTMTTAARAADARRIFTAAGPGWPGGRHHSPDLMIAAPSEQALRRGEFLAVLGEVHTAVNTLMQRLFFESHPRPDALTAAQALDQPEPTLVPLGDFAGGGYRFLYNPASPLDCHVTFSRTHSWLPPERIIPAAALAFVRNGPMIELVMRDGTARYPARALFGPYLRAISAGAFGLPQLPGHTPRLTIDRLVVTRETWRLAPDTLDFALARTPDERLLGGRRLARSQSMPRRLFYRVPGERKPVYLDWQSPAYVEMFAQAVRGARGQPGEVVLTEMLPGPEDCWLADAAGRRYTCELRIAAVDRRPPLSPEAVAPDGGAIG